MTPRERAYQLRDALRARDIALDVAAVDAVEAAILADRAERDAVRESACAAYERALAERDAGEAERVREAVAREREECAQACEGWTTTTVGDQYAHGCAARIRARATSAPAAVPHPASREACEAARAERAQGRDIYADGEGRCEVVPAAAPVASAERLHQAEVDVTIDRGEIVRADVVIGAVRP